MSHLEFIITDGQITVERLPHPSFLIRRRNSLKSLTVPYVWVATMAQTAPGECEVKGYLAKEEMTAGERRALKRIGEELGFHVGRYERVDEDGNFVKLVEIWGSKPFMAAN